MVLSFQKNAIALFVENINEKKIMYIKPDETIKKIVKAAFPDYNGKKFQLSTSVPTRLDSYWDGGSRNYYVFVELATMKSISLPSNHPLFEPNNPRDLKILPNGIVIVQHTFFCGKDMGITIYANQDQLVPLLPEAQELSRDEKIVLYFTKSYKSSYAGISNYRFHLAKKYITQENWEIAKQSLISKKLLNKAGAVTPEGRNQAPGRDFERVLHRYGFENEMCSMCKKYCPGNAAHLHQEQWICESCWDERLKITE